jgi:outer membrane protein assembly factor BamB
MATRGARKARPPLLIVALLAPALWAGAAAASLTLVPSVGRPTATIKAIGAGFAPNEVVDLIFDETVLSHAASGPDGTFSKSVTIPRTAIPGDHTVTATGETSGASASAQFLVRTDWPQFHFDVAHTGQNPYENVLSQSSVEALSLKWSYEAAISVTGSPVVVDGIVYFGDYGTIRSGDYTGGLYAVDAISGHEIWTRFYSGCGGSPAVVSGMVYVATCLGDDVMGLDAKTGETIWTQPVGGGDFDPPAVANGLVYEGANDGQLYAFDAKTGDLRWTADVHLGVSSPATVAGGLVYVGSINARLYAYDALTGAKVWSTQLRGFPGGAAVSQGRLYVGTSNSPPYRVYALDAATGERLWSRTVDGSEGGGGVHGTVTVANGVVYVGAQDGLVYAFDAVTGQPRWTFQTGDAIFQTSPVVANGVVYAGSRFGTFYALDASSGAMLWSYATTEPVGTTAAIADGRLYVGSIDHNMYAFGLP